jgi:GT2 family glycosyltransferase
MTQLPPRPPLGVVVIGRNEGERLVRCLRSLQGRAAALVYVDSGSSDGSVARAQELGAEVVLLPSDVPFTAARARNAGWMRLKELAPATRFVQFVDGDCEVAPGWLETAVARLASSPSVAVVCGRRRERHPDATIYNRLCDMEWNTPIGPAEACGGDALMRVEALEQVGGYDPSLIAGEEPELCLRLRRKGWAVERLPEEMTFHDAAMSRFSQWWKRSLRAGHAYAEGSSRHRDGSERFWRRETRSNWFWGLGVPSAAVLFAPATLGLSWSLLAGYPLLGAKIYRGKRKEGFSVPDARLYAAFCVLGKIPQAVGQLTYWKRRLSGEKAHLIEYKAST